MRTELLKKLNELSEDARIVEDLENAESVTEVIEIFSKYGIEITEEEFGELCKSAVSNEGNELTVEELENVAGGCIKKVVNKIQNWARGVGAKIGHNLWYPNDPW